MHDCAGTDAAAPEDDSVLDPGPCFDAHVVIEDAVDYLSPKPWRGTSASAWPETVTSSRRKVARSAQTLFTPRPREVRFKVLARRAHVGPECIGTQSVKRTRLDHRRENLPLDRDGPARRDPGQKRRLQHVDACIDHVGGREVRGRLFYESLHPTHAVCRDDAEQRGIFYWRQSDRGFPPRSR